MATIRVILGIICLVFTLGNRLPGGDFLRDKIETEVKVEYTRLSILTIARTQIGVREETGKNDGLAVEAYLKYTGNKKGEPWCASFVSWVYAKAGLAMPRSAWSPALFPKIRQTLNPLPAGVFGIYFEKHQRIAHCGLVENTKGSWIYTIEGNTNGAGSREGDGVFRKLRHRRTIAVYANWLKPIQKGELK